MNTTSSVIRLSTVARSPILVADIHKSIISRTARSSSVMSNLSAVGGWARELSRREASMAPSRRGGFRSDTRIMCLERLHGPNLVHERPPELAVEKLEKLHQEAVEERQRNGHHYSRYGRRVV